MHPASARASRRSSRMSTPLANNTRSSPSTATATIVKEPTKPADKPLPTFLDKWIEPPLKHPAPSFEDYGLQRGGVLQEMAPLGQPPNARLRAKVKDMYKSHKKQINGISIHVPVADETSAVETPPQSPSRRASRANSRRLEESLPPALPTAPQPPSISAAATAKESEEDGEYTPKPKSTPKPAAFKPTRLSLKLGRPSPGKDTTPAVSTASTPKVRENSLQRTPSKMDTTLPSPVEPPPLKGRSVVSHGVKAAKEDGNSYIALVMQHAYNDDCLRNPQFHLLLKTVSARAATREQMRAFERHIQLAKRKIRATQAELAKDQVHHGTASVIASLAGRSSTKSKRKPSDSLSNTQKTSVTPQDPAFSPLKKKPRLSAPEIMTASKQPVKAANSPMSPDTPAPNGISPTPISTANSPKSSLSSSSDLSSVDDNTIDRTNSAAGKTRSQSSSRRAAAADRQDRVQSHKKSRAGTKSQKSHRKRSVQDAALMDEQDAEVSSKKQKLSLSFDKVKVTESFTRTPRQGTTRASARHSTGVSNDRIASLKHENSDKSRASLPAPSQTRAATRSATPTTTSRPPKIQRTNAARTKESPIKMKSGVIAGVGFRAGGERATEIGSDGSSENDDYCAACGGGGFLLCCDGCDRAFHCSCVDPPLSREDESLDEPWFCSVCKPTHKSLKTRESRLFTDLVRILSHTNPTAFALPSLIRNYFEDTRTTAEGEYEEVQSGRSQIKRRTGWEEQPDYNALRDAKGGAILCVKCGESAMGRRQIIPCSVCSANWHLDCVDPPMANPPPHRADKESYWMCPRHVAHDLNLLNPSIPTADGSRVHRVRKVLSPTVVTSHLFRGNRNNGHIEIESEPESSGTDTDSDFSEDEEDGIVYRIPEKAIKLDFIAKVKETLNREAATRKRKAAALAPTTIALKAPIVNGIPTINGISTATSARATGCHCSGVNNLEQRPFEDQKAALNLAQLAGRETDLNIRSDTLRTLIRALTAESPQTVVTDMTDVEKGAVPDAAERANLLALQELIKRRLGGKNLL